MTLSGGCRDRSSSTMRRASCCGLWQIWPGGGRCRSSPPSWNQIWGGRLSWTGWAGAQTPRGRGRGDRETSAAVPPSPREPPPYPWLQECGVVWCGKTFFLTGSATTYLQLYVDENEHESFLKYKIQMTLTHHASHNRMHNSTI